MYMLKKWILSLLFIAIPLTSLAQDDVSNDDAYDPFADYSEFEASADEEADIHFFKNGRFFNLAFMLGGRMFTQTLGEVYSPAPAYGMYFTYFFDLRTALQISYTHSQHNWKIPATSQSDELSGTATMSAFAAHMKYYFNTANITRGFADMNPFILGGFALNYRNVTFHNEDIVAKSTPTSVDFGGGLEIPIARKKMYIGGELMYHYVTFGDEGAQVLDGGGQPTGVTPNGDYITLFFVLGINF